MQVFDVLVVKFVARVSSAKDVDAVSVAFGWCNLL